MLGKTLGSKNDNVAMDQLMNQLNWKVLFFNTIFQLNKLLL